MKKPFQILAALCLFAATPALAATNGDYPLEKTLNATTAPPNAYCWQFAPEKYTISDATPDGYTFTTTTTLPDLGTYVSPPYTCTLNGHDAKCAPRINEIAFDGRPNGFDEVIYIKEVAGNFQWVSDTSFLISSLTQLSCEGADCGEPWGKMRQCTLGLTVLYSQH